MKKVFAIALVMALLCIISVGGTLSYFTDTDSDVNTMAVGNVTIDQIEDFSASGLYPYIGEIPASGDFLVANNAITKTVTVKNTGSEEAYIRTLFAFEAVNGADPVATGIIHVNYNKDTDVGVWAPEYTGAIEVDNVKYYVYSFTYKNSYVKDAVTPFSLKQIALDYKQDNTFFGYVGSEYTVLVLSQAVQKQGFDTAGAAFTAAFPITDDELEDWFTIVVTPPVTP